MWCGVSAPVASGPARPAVTGATARTSGTGAASALTSGDALMVGAERHRPVRDLQAVSPARRVLAGTGRRPAARLCLRADKCIAEGRAHVEDRAAVAAAGDEAGAVQCRQVMGHRRGAE